MQPSELIEEVQRHKAAITRTKISRPTQIGLDLGLINESSTFFDYGCGKGSDVEFLIKSGISASGWDPHFYPGLPKNKAQVVNLGYVLNVIEDVEERREALLKAYDLADQVLIVSVRIESLDIRRFKEFGDGYITSFGTFQKLFEPDEFKDYLQEELPGKVVIAAPGVALVFKDLDLYDQYFREKFERQRRVRTLTLVQKISQHPSVDDLVEFYENTARLPSVLELPQISDLLNTGISTSRLLKAVQEKANPEKVQLAIENEKNEIILFFADYFLANKSFPKTKSLSTGMLDQVRSFFKSLAGAQSETMKFLQTLADPDLVKKKCRESKVGKKLPGCLYVHSSAISEIPQELQILIKLGELVVGELPYDLIKIKEHGRSLSFLFYEDFFTVAHPKLSLSIKVKLARGFQSIKQYENAKNRPILHRKETFLSENNPYFKKFSGLTKKEEELGLLSSRTIGYNQQWEELLESKGVQIKGHRIYHSK